MMDDIKNIYPFVISTKAKSKNCTHKFKILHDKYDC